MHIKKGSWPIPEIFKIVQHAGHIPEREMYTVLNMGIGMMVVVDKKYSDNALSFLNSHGVKSYLIGKIDSVSMKMRLA
jgi:phosphoribosylformylglycinamidine cyclo-ligase